MSTPFEEIKNAYEEDCTALSDRFTPLLKARAVALLKRLQPILPVKELRMGMGGWALYGANATIVHDRCDPKDTWTMPENEAFSSLTEQYLHMIQGATDEDVAAAMELKSILEWCTLPENHVGIFDLKNELT